MRRRLEVGVVDREAPVPYGDDFGFKNEDIGPENAYFWDTNLDGLVKSHITRHSGESRSP